MTGRSASSGTWAISSMPSTSGSIRSSSTSRGLSLRMMRGRSCGMPVTSGGVAGLGERVARRTHREEDTPEGHAAGAGPQP